ncbi:BspA family leucine-rich repeat surface protein [Xylocopilactobacillus apicola]|uniref:Surface protein n=1 Tax=Xylocopilactobacillus apicola TaxID=2932184 RepID=A0AAU9D2G2_9LACO|nr:BspA family leucine-rich repeat surface protein [Xylocopilactobacillus apicola]BDR57924.1 hypothetical protein XA3_03650 [Xylocopilactobacillus apicola]
MRLAKKLGYILVLLIGILTLFFSLNFKQEIKAVEFPQNVSISNSNKKNDEKESIFGSFSKIQPRGSGSQTPVSMGPGDSQNFFATVGSAVAKVNDDGTWDTISINEPKYYQVGAVTLNATVDMTKDFNFSWNLKIERSSLAFLADGLGFIFHPLYSPGETITDLQGGSPYVLPAVFGRHSDTTPVTTTDDPDLGQNIHSIGINGGDLGISDIMNAISFKIDTNYNGVMGTRVANTPYGSTSHYLDVDRYPDDYYAGTTSGGVANGSFVTTDNTGFSSASQYSAPLNGLAVTPKSNSFGSVSGDAIVVPDNTWRPMQIFYTAATHTLKVTIGDAATGGQVNWTKVLNANEQAIIASKPSWAFSVLGSTGAGVEGNTIKNIRGTFTPGDSVITTRYIDENGNDLQPPVSTLEANWQVTHPGSTQFVDSSSPATIVKNGKIYRRAQVNGTFFNNNTRTNKRLGAPGSGSTVDTSGGNVTVTTNFENIIFVNYVYRQEFPQGSTDVTSDLQLSTDGTTFSKTANIHPGDEVTFKYTAKNNTLPGVWSKVTAVQSLSGLFTPKGTLPAGVTQKDGSLYVPIKVGAINDIRTGETGTNTVKLKYEGVEKASLTANDAGQITITNNPATSGAPKTSTIVSKVSIYDQSNQLIDDNGNPVYGSYFYNPSNPNAPLASTDTVYNTANFAPMTDSVTVNDLGWWDFNATTKVLTIYPHELNYVRDNEYIASENTYGFPWWGSRLQIEKTIIKPGVTAKGRLRTLFYDHENMTSIEGLEDLDTSEVTDMYFMFCQCNSLINLNVSNFNTSKVTDMRTMFGNCWSLTSLDVKNFDTHNVTYMSEMFKSCKKVTNLEVKDFDTSKVTSMRYLFSGCESLTSLDVTGFNTSNVTDMGYVFSSCSSITNLDLRSFDTSKVTDMKFMFGYCTSLSDLKWNATKFNTNNVTEMEYMFRDCSSLKNIDVSHFNTSKVTNVNYMFNGCTSLASLDLSSFDLTNVVHKGSLNHVESGYNEMLSDTPKLWKLTLGPNTKIPDVTVSGTLISAKLKDPTPGNKVIDLNSPVPPNPQYYVTNAQWREASTDDFLHEPDGAAKTAAEIMSESATANRKRTYVWDQIGKQTLEATPGNIDLGTHAGHLKNQEYKSSAQNLKLTDNRNVRTGKNWRIEAAVTKPFKHATDPTKVINGDPLYYHDTTSGTTTHLTSTAQVLYNGTATNLYQDVKDYPWNLSFKASPSDIPKAGKYNATTTFTLVSALP